MQDIAATIGATYFSEKTGDDLSLLTINDLGFADKIIVGKDTTVLIKNEEASPEVQERIAQLRVQQENTTDPVERKFIDSRIASLAGAIGSIYVGGNSDVEQKELYDRVDDSVCAVKSALEEGIVVGAGMALLNASDRMVPKKNEDHDYRTAWVMVHRAIRAPFKQILTNAGLDANKVLEQIDGHKKGNDNVGYDVKNDQYGDLFALGVIDPLKVTKNALINASSVATTILSTNAIVTHQRVKNATDR